MGLLFTNGGKYEYNYFNRNSNAKVSKKMALFSQVIKSGNPLYKYRFDDLAANCDSPKQEYS